MSWPFVTAALRPLSMDSGRLSGRAAQLSMQRNSESFYDLANLIQNGWLISEPISEAIRLTV